MANRVVYMLAYIFLCKTQRRAKIFLITAIALLCKPMGKLGIRYWLNTNRVVYKPKTYNSAHVFLITAMTLLCKSKGRKYTLMTNRVVHRPVTQRRAYVFLITAMILKTNKVVQRPNSYRPTSVSPTTHNRGFAPCGTHPCTHNFAPPLGFPFAWRDIKKSREKKHLTFNIFHRKNEHFCLLCVLMSFVTQL